MFRWRASFRASSWPKLVDQSSNTCFEPSPVLSLEGTLRFLIQNKKIQRYITSMFSCLESSVPLPEPEVEPVKEPAEDLPAPQEPTEGDSSSHLLAVFLLLLLAVIVIAALVYMKHQRRPHYDNWEDDEDAL